MATTSPSIGTSPRTQDMRTDKMLPGRQGIYWAIGIAVVLLFIVFAMRPVSDTAPIDTTRGTMYDDGSVNTTTDGRAIPPSEQQR